MTNPTAADLANHYQRFYDSGTTDERERMVAILRRDLDADPAGIDYRSAHLFFAWLKAQSTP